jgi:hypothetical protein
MPEGPLQTMTNLFSNLHRWVHRQSENFLTEVFAFLINTLLFHDEIIGRRLLHWLCDEADCFSEAVPTVATQDKIEKGRLDLRLDIPGKVLVFVEIKQWANLHNDQLRPYRQELEKTRLQVQKLVVLTMFPPNYGPEWVQADTERRWPEVAEWLAKNPPSSGASIFLVEQFRDFLKQQGMTMEKVERELAKGITALRHLDIMLPKAIEQAGVPLLKKKGRRTKNYIGYFLDAGRFWTGVEFSFPNHVSFTFQTPSYNEKLRVMSGWELHEWSKLPCQRLALKSEEIDFFSKNAQDQCSMLATFLAKAHGQAVSMLLDPQAQPVLETLENEED